jgi:multicomponent Na+:H+ antiporter subunit E
VSRRRWPAVGLAFAVLWLFVTGVSPGAHPVRSLVGSLLVGLTVGLSVAYVTRELYSDVSPFTRSIRAVPAAVLYLMTFLYELVTANIEVAYRVLAPSMPIKPDVIAVPLRVESDAAITTIANSITLTPGTLTMDHDAETNTLYVHGIDCEDEEALLAPIRTWEDYALVIFEARDPSTPVPDRPGRPSADGGRLTDGAGPGVTADAGTGTDIGGDADGE